MATFDAHRGEGGRMNALTPALITAAVSTKGAEAGKHTSYAVVGAGWRADIFLRLAYLLPHRFTVTAVLTRSAESGNRLEQAWGVTTVRTVDELLATGTPDFVVVAVPWETTPEYIREFVRRGVRVLAETPPAPDLDGLRSLWSDVGASHLVQVAEQYPFMPLHAARAALVHEGVIGTPTSVHVSSTHQYHAVALMRAFLGLGITPAKVRSHTRTAPLIDPISDQGWSHDLTPKPARTILSTIEFEGGRVGVYDFTDNQWWNPVRPDHLTVRGSSGEIHDRTVARMIDDVTPVVSTLDRSDSGREMNYEGFDLTAFTFEGRVVYRNAFEGARLADDEIGTASLLESTGAWAHGTGAAPYPLAEAIHDHHIGVALEDAAASGEPVVVGREAWADEK